MESKPGIHIVILEAHDILHSPSPVLSHVSACHSVVFDMCYMRFVPWHTGEAGNDDIYQPHWHYTTYHLLSSHPAYTALPQVDATTLPSGGSVCGVTAGGGWGCGLGGGDAWWKVNWPIDQAVEKRAKVPQVGRPVSFLLLLWSLTNL